MKSTRLIIPAAAVVFVLTCLFWPKPRTSEGPSAPVLPAPITPTASVSAGAADSQRPLPIYSLNAPGQSVQVDLGILQGVFESWQTNFSALGNPVGTNAEITAALCGDNTLRLDLIPRDHPAINARGELCDRWGTPFRFHQNSGTEMQVISAGPDRDFATGDDVAMP